MIKAYDSDSRGFFLPLREVSSRVRPSMDYTVVKVTIRLLCTR